MSAKPLVIVVVGLVFIGVCGWVAFRAVGPAPSPEVGLAGVTPAAGSRPAASASSTPAGNTPPSAAPAAPTAPAASSPAVSASAPDAPGTNPAGNKAEAGAGSAEGVGDVATTDAVGVAPSIAPNANPQVASVAEAARTGKHPERLSPLMAPAPFNPEAFARNPAAYLNVVEPGRVFQTARPAPTVPVLMSVGGASHEIPVGGTCELVVKTAPKAPVTFTTMDLGTFKNGLTSQTLQADDQGIATATYAASGGVIAGVSILAGSPAASGQIKFYVFVVDESLTKSP